MKQLLLLGMLVLSACALQPVSNKKHKIDYPPAAWGPIMDEASLNTDRLYRSR